MTRLYDRIVRKGHLDHPPGMKVLCDVGRNGLDEAVVVATDNVAEYFFDHSEKTDWSIEDMPNIAPPWPVAFIEARAPSFRHCAEHGRERWTQHLGQSGWPPKSWGVLRQAFDVNADEDEPENALAAVGIATALKKGLLENEDGQEIWEEYKEIRGVRWIVLETLYLEPHWSEPIGPLVGVFSFLGPDGGILKRDDGRVRSIFVTCMGDEEANEFISSYSQQFFAQLHFAISLAHCKNVVSRVLEPAPKLSKKHLKRHGVPLTKHYTLEIEPMKRVLKTEGRLEEVGLRKALHIARGHFKTYTEKKPLFGKLSGTWWWGQHMRGATEEGIIEKDYAIGKPTE